MKNKNALLHKLILAKIIAKYKMRFYSKIIKDRIIQKKNKKNIIPLKSVILSFWEKYCDCCTEEKEFRKSNKNVCLISCELIVLKKINKNFLILKDNKLSCTKFKNE